MDEALAETDAGEHSARRPVDVGRRISRHGPETTDQQDIQVARADQRRDPAAGPGIVHTAQAFLASGSCRHGKFPLYLHEFF
jgi:hypothetical protein